MLIEELYDALIEAGASEAKAKAAARAIADYEKRFGGIERELASLRSEFRTELTEFRSEVGRNFAEVNRQFTEFRSDVETKFLELRSDMERKFLEFRSDMDKQFAGVDKQFAGVDKQFAGVDKQFAGVDRQFAESRAYVEKEFTDIRGTLKLHNWMMGTTIALLTALFLKMFYCSVSERSTLAPRFLARPPK